MKYLLLAGLITLVACRPCEPVIHDMGSIPLQLLELVPYKNGDRPALVHSGGKVINFSTRRVTHTREEQMCHHCCDIIVYQEDICTLIPGHPVLQTQFVMSNPDSSMISCTVWIDHSRFIIPVNDMQRSSFTRTDSILIGSRYYKEVFLLHYEPDFYEDIYPVYADSLYYSFADGILKVTMTNEEYYQVSD